MFFRRSFQRHRRRGLFRIRRLLKRELLLEEVGYVKQYQLSARLLIACVARVQNGKRNIGRVRSAKVRPRGRRVGAGVSLARGLAPQFRFPSLSNVCHAPMLDSPYAIFTITTHPQRCWEISVWPLSKSYCAFTFGCKMIRQAIMSHEVNFIDVVSG